MFQRPAQGEPPAWTPVSEYTSPTKDVRISTHAMEIHGQLVLHTTTAHLDESLQVISSSSAMQVVPDTHLHNLFHIPLEKTWPLVKKS